MILIIIRIIKIYSFHIDNKNNTLKMKNLRSLSPSNRLKNKQRSVNPMLFKSISKALASNEKHIDSTLQSQFTVKHMSTSEIPFLKWFNKKSDDHSKASAFVSEVTNIYNQRSFIQNNAGLIQKDLEEFYSLVHIPSENTKSTEVRMSSFLV